MVSSSAAALEDLESIFSGNTDSLRYSYATEELLAGTEIHTLSKQMGTSVRMLEAHYSKLTATMAAERLA